MYTYKNLLFLLLFSGLQPAMAEPEEPRWYKVEVVAFSYITKTGMAQERWPTQAEALDLTDAVELARSGRKSSRVIGKAPVAFQRLPDNELELKADANAISRSKGRHLLLHTAWLQPMFDRQRATAVHLKGNERFTPLPIPGSTFEQDDFQRGDRIYSDQLVAEDTLEGTEAVAIVQESVIPETPQIYLRASRGSAKLPPRAVSGAQVPAPVDTNILDSSFTVSIGRYLHVWLEMIYREPIAISPEIDGDYQEFILPSYRIKMHRRMRSNELHYIDHPMVGMLVKITRHKLPPTSIQSNSQGTDLPIATDAIPAQ